MNLNSMPAGKPGQYEDESDVVQHGLPKNDHIWNVVDDSDRYQGGAHNITHEAISPSEKVHATQEWADKSIVQHHISNPSSQRIHVVQIGESKWIMDGHHRYLANKIAGRNTPATIFHWRDQSASR